MAEAVSPQQGRDEVIEALEALVIALQENARGNDLAQQRAQVIFRERAAGKPWREIVNLESRPLIVELATQNLNRLLTAGSRLRRAEARALHDEGMTMEQIAKLFGVSRQRVSALLRSGNTNHQATGG